MKPAPILLLCALLCAVPGPAQKAPAKSKPSPDPIAAAAQTAQEPAPAPQPVDEPLGRLTPRGCVMGFLQAAQRQDYARAAQYLDVKKPPAETEELARQLQSLLDVGLSASLDTVSREPEGNLADNLRTNRDLIGTVKTDQGSLDITLTRVERQGKPAIWLFSSETMSAVPAMSQAAGQHQLEAKFPRWMVETRVFSFPVWRWVMMLLSIAAIVTGAWVVSRLITALLRFVFRRILPSGGKGVAHSFHGSIFVLLMAVSVRYVAPYSVTVLGRQRWGGLAWALGVIGVAWLINVIASLSAQYVMQRKDGSLQVERATFISIALRVFKIAVVLFAFLAALSHAGIDVSAMLAGLGIGGIALALAAQKTLEDFFGGLSIVGRKALRVGDLCKIGDDFGFVEDIGLSSLRLRTLDRCVVALPNSKVAQAGIVNFTMRDKFWVHEIFNLCHDTPSEALGTAIIEINRALRAAEEVEKTSTRARLIHLDRLGLQLEIAAYLLLPPMDAARCLQAQQQIFLEILTILEKANIKLAVPGQLATHQPRPLGEPPLLRNN